jgi:hypothetical protein
MQPLSAFNIDTTRRPCVHGLHGLLWKDVGNESWNKNWVVLLDSFSVTLFALAFF